MTYKKFTGYSPGVAVIGDLIVGIENRDGNANVRFHQQDTLAAPAHVRLWRPLRSTRSCSTYVPTAAAHFTTVCLRCADGSVSR